ncbi:hypothetical protein H8M03_06255 [Sphingomonas sabuli]|uniref:Uncharacterized protein n=1 Tax=Sphingomonas sabuli TaxID=2764186 RepID=A0A7G9L5K8_9SPHN|nr:hypothetical protein [Sphingomonas sabuli]QNM83907.1 hypothetical protein H8M03_06255 [Sphingomonas sabuli]
MTGNSTGRVLLLKLDQSEVVAKCETAKVGISAVETLASGGTRLVCMSVDGAEQMRRKLKSKLISGEVTREAYRPAHSRA